MALEKIGRLDNAGEEFRAWHAGNENSRSIGIECTDLTMEPDRKVSDATINALVALIQDIQKRYSCKMIIIGHRDVMPTLCPGPYLYARLPEIRNRVNGRAVTPPLVNNVIGGNMVNQITRQVADMDFDVYASQTMDYKIIRKVKKGTVFTSKRYASGQNPDGNGYSWFEVEGSGWAYGAWFSSVSSNSTSGVWKAEKSTFIPDRTLNVRNEPNTNSAIVTSYSAGQSVNYDRYLIDQNGYAWIHYVSFNGKDRYMATGEIRNGNRISLWGDFPD